MKRSWILGALATLFLMQGTVKVVLATNIEYPFESIRIVEAKRFQVKVPDTIVNTSLFFPDVAVGETLNVYIGSLTLVQGEENLQEALNIDTVQNNPIPPAPSNQTTMVVVSTEDGTDLAQFIINSYSRTNEYETFSFAWHILINPTIGVYKDLEKLSNPKELSLTYTFAGETWEFRDDKQTLYPTVENSYTLETNLDVIVAAYIESPGESTDIDSAMMYHALKAFSEFGLTGCATNSQPSSSNPSSSNGEVPLSHTALIAQLSVSLKAVFE
jgi:hypothetical protein